MKITSVPSPNFGPRRHGLGPDMVILHHTAMQDCAAAVARLCAPEFEVSAHYVIAENGEIIQLVDEAMRAWHAGAGAWGAITDLNSHSIGIELANPGPLAGFPPFPAPQMAALEDLLTGLMTRHNIPAQNIIAHSDMAPTRKFDPGAKFDWRRLALGGLSVWPNTISAPDSDFTADAQRFGYCLPESGAKGEAQVLAAFRLRFRPGAIGPTDATDRAMIHDLATRFPVDRAASRP